MNSATKKDVPPLTEVEKKNKGLVVLHCKLFFFICVGWAGAPSFDFPHYGT